MAPRTRLETLGMMAEGRSGIYRPYVLTTLKRPR